MTFDDEEYIVKALQAGAREYLLKDIPPGDSTHLFEGLELDKGVVSR
jgi:DNA-binding NarL/FixJ family response regulator